MLQEENVKVWFFFHSNFKQIAWVKCHKNSKIKIWEFKVTNCWKGGKCTLTKNLAAYYDSSDKMWTKDGDKMYKKGQLSHFVGRNLKFT